MINSTVFILGIAAGLAGCYLIAPGLCLAILGFAAAAAAMLREASDH